MPRVLVFDVNETLLDLQALDAPFRDVFGDASIRRAWFSQLLMSALVATVTDAYADFSTIGRTALEMVAAQHDVALDDASSTRILEAMRRLPPHPDVQESLQRLQEADFRLAALSNGPPHTLNAQLDHAGLTSYFEKVLSADAVRRLKPAAAPYRYAAGELGVAEADLRLVAAHAWDVTGAMRAGCAAAFVARPGKVLDPLAPRPDIIGSDLNEISTLLIEHEATR